MNTNSSFVLFCFLSCFIWSKLQNFRGMAWVHLIRHIILTYAIRLKHMYVFAESQTFIREKPKNVFEISEQKILNVQFFFISEIEKLETRVRKSFCEKFRFNKIIWKMFVYHHYSLVFYLRIFFSVAESVARVF